MDEGKELLYQAINYKLEQIKTISSDDIVFDGVNLALLSTSLDESIDNFANVSDSVLNKVLDEVKTDKEDLNKHLIQLRDLLIGKRDYNLDVKIKKDYEKSFKKFKAQLEKILKKLAPGIKNISEVEENVLTLRDILDRNDVIMDFKTIELIMKEYDSNNFDSNMLVIMKFININNLEKMTGETSEIKTLDMNKVKRVKLDEKWDDILFKLDLDYKELPNYLISEIKRVDAKEVRSVFDLIRKNKAEDYGILHLIDKENYVAKISLMLYSTEDAIKETIDSLEMGNKVDIPLLKAIINSILSSFIIKDNAYYNPKHDSFMNNLNIIKGIDINYKVLIKRCPLFMLSNTKILEYSLKYTEAFNGDAKQLINRCYKTMAIYPEIILENINVLNKFGIDLKEYFNTAKDNYNLLKIPNLEYKLNTLIQEYDIRDTSDYEYLNKLLINRLSKIIIGGAK